jgi:alpha-L-rhamnosidase
MTTGLVATAYLYQVLADFNDPNAAYTMLTQSSYPGVLWAATAPGGTLFESLDNEPDDSHDHAMFASYDAWFYRGLAGLRLDDVASTGRVSIAPGLVDGMSWAQASVDTVRGNVSSRWERVGSGVRFTVTTPSDVTATFEPPVGSGTVVVDGQPLAGAPRSIPLTPGKHVIETRP